MLGNFNPWDDLEKTTNTSDTQGPLQELASISQDQKIIYKKLHYNWRIFAFITQTSFFRGTSGASPPQNVVCYSGLAPGCNRLLDVFKFKLFLMDLHKKELYWPGTKF